MPTFEGMKRGYANLFAKMRVNASQYERARKSAQELLQNKQRYIRVSTLTGVPWFWIAITHELEGNSNFGTHLHNGDSLSQRTKRVPKGRPPNDSPPFEWEVSAVDALLLKGLNVITEWSLPRCLYEFERFNGWGYLQYRKINSPYVWSFSNLYEKGKYTQDGKYDKNFVSTQIGAAVLLRVLIDMGEVEMDEPITEEQAMEEFKKSVATLELIAPALVGLALSEGSKLAIKMLAEAFAPEAQVEPTAKAVTDKLENGTFTQIKQAAQKAEKLVKDLIDATPVIPPLPTPAAPDVPVTTVTAPNSKIDDWLGGESFTGLKTVIGMAGYVAVTILGIYGVLPADLVSSLQLATGALMGAGLLAKLDRISGWLTPILATKAKVKSV